MSKKNRHLTIGVDEDIPFSQSAILGLQHVLAMDVYVPPFILATALALSPGDAAGPVSYTHLDVYKRQTVSRLISNVVFKNFSGSFNVL